MNAETVALLGRFTIAILALIAGASFVYSGVGLYRQGIAKHVGNLKAVWGDRQFVLNNAAPGSFLGMAGVAVMITSMVTSPDYKTAAAAPGTRPTNGSTTEVSQSISVPVHQFAANRDTGAAGRVIHLSFASKNEGLMRTEQTLDPVAVHNLNIIPDTRVTCAPPADTIKATTLDCLATLVVSRSITSPGLFDVVLTSPRSANPIGDVNLVEADRPNLLALTAAFLLGGAIAMAYKQFIHSMRKMSGR